MCIRFVIGSLIALVALAASRGETPSTTAFTYQGQLKEGGRPASGLYDLRFRLFDALAGGAQVGTTLCANDVNVTNGHFTVSLDFGAQFGGQERFLEIEVRVDTGLDCANGAGFTILAPRQPLTATPYALFSAGPWQTIGANLSYTAGRVGIGTNNPSPLLSVQGGGLHVFDSANQGIALATNSFSLTSAFNEDPVYQYNFSNDRHTWLTGGSEHIVLDNSGRVGIGTNAPEGPLHVQNGSAGTVTANANSVAIFERNGTSFLSLLSPDANERGIVFGEPSNANAGGLYFNPSDNLDGLSIRTGGNNTRMVVNSTGNVGIGTTAPVTDLHIFENSGTARIRVESADNQAGISFLSDSTVENVIYSPNGSDDLRFFVNNADRVSITSAGNVGIGTTSPDATLEVKDNQGQISINSTLSPTAGSILELRNVSIGNTTTGAVNFVDPAGVMEGQMEYENNGLSFSTDGAFRMRLDPAGNLGLGTTAPTARLHVVAPSGNSSVILPSSSISGSEIADEPGIACDIVNSFDVLIPFSSLHIAASRSITCPADGFVMAIGTVELWGQIGSDNDVFVGISDSANAFIATSKHRTTLFGAKRATVTVQGVFLVSAGSITIRLLTQPDGSELTMFAGPTHLTLLFVPTSYGTVDTD